jgi:hypothetical protein
MTGEGVGGRRGLGWIEGMERARRKEGEKKQGGFGGKESD